MKDNGKKINGFKSEAEAQGAVSTAEKAQFEAFKRGEISRETFGQWISNDLKSAVSLLMTVLHDPQAKEVIIDLYYRSYIERKEED